jgi:hypothetical protein
VITRRFKINFFTILWWAATAVMVCKGIVPLWMACWVWLAHYEISIEWTQKK